MKFFNLICSATLLFPLFAVASHGAGGARIENFGIPVFGKAVKIDGVNPRAMALCVDGKTLYIGSYHYLYVVDISEPMKPRILGKVGGLGNVRQIAVQDGIAYVASRESGLWIVDARNPESPKVLSRYDCIELATGIDVAGSVAFLGQRNNGVEFIDVSDPANPEHIRIIKTPESQSVKYRDGYLFSGEWHSGEVTVFDARDMADVKVVSRPKMDGYGDGIDLGGNLLFASTGHHSILSGKTKAERFGNGHGLEIFDISDISNPIKISSVKFPKFYYIGNDFWTPRRSGNTVFAADTFNGLFAVDISDLKNPRIAGRITTPPAKEGASPSSPISSVAVADGAVYVSSLNYGVMAVECPNARASSEGGGVLPKNPSYRAQYSEDSEKFFVWKPERSVQVRAVAVNGDVAYAACGAEGIVVLKLSDSGFEKIGRIKMPFAGDVKIKGGRLYAAEGQNGLAVYDIDPDSPEKLSEVGRLESLSPESSLVLWVWVPEGNFIVATDRVGGIFFIDARDLKNMKVVFRKGGCPGWNKYFSGGIVGGKYAGMSYANNRFEWFDLSGEKPVPANASYKNRPGVSNGCCVFKDKVLWTNRAGEVVLLEPNQPENSDGSEWKSVPVGGSKVFLPAWCGGNLVAFTNRIERSVALADFGDEKNPKSVWAEKISGNPDTPVYWRGRLVIPAGYGGILMTRERFSAR